MGWEELLDENREVVLPWIGGRRIHNRDRSWRIVGALPVEHGWYRFKTTGNRDAALLGPGDPDPDFEEGLPIVKGYLTGNRLIPDNARVVADPKKLTEQTITVFLVEPGLDRFVRAVAVKLPATQQLIYSRQEFPQGPETAVLEAYQDRLDSVNHIPGVTPNLDLAFRWISLQRAEHEERERRLVEQRAEEERRRVAEEQMREALRNAGSAVGRRQLAQHDFDGAARAALRISGATFLDSRPGNRGEVVVQWRFRNRRFECVVDKYTLQILDAGVCLGHGEEKGDTLFTLESLPSVVGEAIDRDILVVYRHI